MSKAQELKRIRKENDVEYRNREFVLIEGAESVESYYKNVLSDAEIELALAEYEGNLNVVSAEFSERTQLKGYDVGFLMFATMLQCMRIYILNPMIEKLTEIEKANSHGGKEDFLHEMQERIFSKVDTGKRPIQGELYASLESIISTRGVPYDTTSYESVKYKLFKGANHRFATLGHDPILGLLFGTANILTNTITCVDDGKFFKTLNTHAVVYDQALKNPRIGLPVSTLAMITAVCERVNGDDEDKLAVVAAIIKQLIHIATDLYTPAGISLPGANLILSKANTERLTKYISTGDVLKVGSTAGVSVLINTLIGAIHGCKLLFENDGQDMSKELYQVRTKKILLYSNLLASSSSVIATGFGTSKVDIGGLIVTGYRLFSDTRFIDKIKCEFLNSKVSEIYAEKVNGLEIYY